MNLLVIMDLCFNNIFLKIKINCYFNFTFLDFVRPDTNKGQNLYKNEVYIYYRR